ncbi:MAG: hypothetical protein Q7V63_05455 [Gammaproteobacteria bacterium]|nr:hypothetical protein [Gammaproteobacteria bacterium]
MNGITTASDKVLEEVLQEFFYGFKDDSGAYYLLDVTGPAAEALTDSFNKLVETCVGVHPHEGYGTNLLVFDTCYGEQGSIDAFRLLSTTEEPNSYGNCMVNASQYILDHSGLDCDNNLDSPNDKILAIGAGVFASILLLMALACLISRYKQHCAPRQLLGSATAMPSAELKAPLLSAVAADLEQAYPRPTVENDTKPMADIKYPPIMPHEPYRNRGPAGSITGYELTEEQLPVATAFKSGSESNAGKKASATFPACKPA